MADLDAASDLRFEPPGPGPWTLDPVHFPRPVTRYWAETHPEPFGAGTADFARFYGMLIDGMKTSYVNGFAYSQIQPVPDEEVPQRLARAEEVMAKKLWREQLRDWEENRKPASIAAHRAIQAVDPSALPDDELAAYLVRCRDHHAAMLSQHMRFTASAIVPTGDFVLHAAEWTGRGPAELLSLTRGSAPVSAGSSEEHERLVGALRDDPSALKLLESDDDPGRVLDELRSLGGEAGQAASAYIDLVGYRPLDGFDISEPSALEMPDALLRAVRGAVAGRAGEADALEDRIADVRRSAPEAHRAEFDQLLAESRLTYRLRDERGVYSDVWASGLMRRAALAAGRRLAERGRIYDAENAVDAALDELCLLVTRSEGPSSDELAARAKYRATHSAKNAPPLLGPPPPPPPDPSGLPPTVARLMHAVGFAMGSVFGGSEQEHEEHLLRGLAASAGVYEGPARVISGPSEFSRIVEGDVLVTPATTEAFNILLPLLGAIVTDSGGLLSHSAIVAREYGIPGVVGTREATERIADGQRVRVDGDA
ncbi:MAG: PEP-utilizing enzyme, partial [Acidimicrobiales bacterium]